MAKPALLLLVLCLVNTEGFLQDTTQQTRNNNWMRREFSNENEYQRHTKFDRNFFGRSLERSLDVRQEARERRDLKPEADSTIRRQLKPVEKPSRILETERRDRSSEDRRSIDRTLSNERFYENSRRVIGGSAGRLTPTYRRLSSERQQDGTRRSVDHRVPTADSTRRKQSELPVSNRQDRSTEDRRFIDRTLADERYQDNSRRVRARSTEDRRSVSRRISMVDFELPVSDRRDRSTEDRRSSDRNLSNKIRQDDSRRVLDRSTEDRRSVDSLMPKSDSRRRQHIELPVLDRRDRSTEDRRSVDLRLLNERRQEDSRRVFVRSTEENRTSTNEKRQDRSRRTFDRRSVDRRVTNADLTRRHEQIGNSVVDRRDRSTEDRRSIDRSLSNGRRQADTGRATQDRTSMEDRRSMDDRLFNERSMEDRRSVAVRDVSTQVNTRLDRKQSSYDMMTRNDNNLRQIREKRSFERRELDLLNRQAQSFSSVERTMSSRGFLGKPEESREHRLNTFRSSEDRQIHNQGNSRDILVTANSQRIDNSRSSGNDRRLLGTSDTFRRTQNSGNGSQALRRVSEERIAGVRQARSADNRRQTGSTRARFADEIRDTRTERLDTPKQIEISREISRSVPKFSDNRRKMMRSVSQDEDQEIRSLDTERQVNNRRQMSSPQVRYSFVERRQVSSDRQARPQEIRESRLVSSGNKRNMRDVRLTRNELTRHLVNQRQIVTNRQAQPSESRFVDSRRIRFLGTRQVVDTNPGLSSSGNREHLDNSRQFQASDNSRDNGNSGSKVSENGRDSRVIFQAPNRRTQSSDNLRQIGKRQLETSDSTRFPEVLYSEDTRHVRQYGDRQVRSSDSRLQRANERQTTSSGDRRSRNVVAERQDDSRRLVSPENQRQVRDSERQFDEYRTTRSMGKNEQPTENRRFSSGLPQKQSVSNENRHEISGSERNRQVRSSETRRQDSLTYGKIPVSSRRYRSVDQTDQISTGRREIRSIIESRVPADGNMNSQENRQTRTRLSRYADNTEQNRLQSLEQRDENNNRLFSLGKLQHRVNTKSDVERRMATPFGYSKSEQIQSFQEVDYMPEMMKSTMWLNTAKILLFALIVAQIFSSSSKTKRNSWFNNLTDFVSGVTKAKVL